MVPRMTVKTLWQCPFHSHSPTAMTRWVHGAPDLTLGAGSPTLAHAKGPLSQASLCPGWGRCVGPPWATRDLVTPESCLLHSTGPTARAGLKCGPFQKF